MSAVLEITDEITVEELESEIRAYEMFHGIKTDELLRLIESNSDEVDRIEDAGFWRSSYELLCRLKQAPKTEEINEDPKRVLVLIYAGQFGAILQGIRGPHSSH